MREKHSLENANVPVLHWNLKSFAKEASSKKNSIRLSPLSSPIVILEVSLSEWASLNSALCAMRAANTGVLVKLSTDKERPLGKSQCVEICHSLRDWDQLSFGNLITLAGELVPNELKELLNDVAQHEDRILRQWLFAVQTSLHFGRLRFPWRSFIRRVVNENFDIAKKIFEEHSSEENNEIFRQSYIQKRKVISSHQLHKKV